MTQINNNILEQAREQGLARPSAGMSVPDGYFDDFAARMAAMLPERPEIENPTDAPSPRRTLWQKTRTYVYMAAMFAGVWCMMQMLAMISGMGKLQPLDQNDVIAQAMANDDFVMDYIYDDYTDADIVDEMISDTGYAPDFNTFEL